MGNSHLSVEFELIALTVMIVVIVADLLMVVKRPHVPSFKECLAWVGFYVSAALIFGLVLYLVTSETEVMAQFYAGWLTEYSLSIDNLFIFVIILTRFKVPPHNQQTVLMIGIIIALVLRAIMILAGAAIIERWSWVFYIFGAFLIWTAWMQVKPGHGDPDAKENILIRTVRKRVAFTDDYDGLKLRTERSGSRMWTPMLMVIIALGTTDLMFALDSIPAIFGITQDPFLVFSTNLFALMGLRQLYFLLGGLLDRLVYLPYGLGFILAYIGVKLILQAMYSNQLSWINNGEGIPVWHPSSVQSLGVIATALVITTVLSLTVGRKRLEQKQAEQKRAEQETSSADESAH